MPVEKNKTKTKTTTTTKNKNNKKNKNKKQQHQKKRNIDKNKNKTKQNLVSSFLAFTSFSEFTAWSLFFLFFLLLLSLFVEARGLPMTLWLTGWTTKENSNSDRTITFTNTFGKGMNSLILTSYRFNSTITVLLQR